MLLVGVALEVRALTNSVVGDTLSERVWWLVSLLWIGPLIRCLLGAFMIWLTVHLTLWGLVRWQGHELIVCLCAGTAVWVAWMVLLLLPREPGAG